MVAIDSSDFLMTIFCDMLIKVIGSLKMSNVTYQVRVNSKIVTRTPEPPSIAIIPSFNLIFLLYHISAADRGDWRQSRGLRSS